MKISFRGLTKLMLNKESIKHLKELAGNNLDKMQKYGSFSHVILHIKQHEKTGKRHRYEVHSRITSPGEPIAAKSQDWDIKVALRKSLKDIENQLKHQFRS
jgi:ribosome-associated translation inhibitor RaiA